jgi:Protein of unknown function (DUF1091)
MSTASPTFIDFTYNIQKLDSNETAINVICYFAVDILKLLTHFELNVQKDKNNQNYELQLPKTSTDVCKMTQGVIGNFLAKMIMHNVDEFINFEFKCPFKKLS